MRSKGKSAKKRFFLNGNLHRVIHINRSMNEITAYDYIDSKIKVYPLSEVLSKKQNAFKVSEVAEFMNRHHSNVKAHLLAGDFGDVQSEYSFATRKPGAYFFSEDQVMKVRDFYAQLHRGRPRKDGRITSSKIPTREELRGMIQSGRVFYVKENDEFVPVWKAQDW